MTASTHDSTQPDPDEREPPRRARDDERPHRLAPDEAPGTPRWNPDDGDYA